MIQVHCSFPKPFRLCKLYIYCEVYSYKFVTNATKDPSAELSSPK